MNSMPTSGDTLVFCFHFWVKCGRTAFAEFQRSAIGIAGMSDGDSHQNQKKRGGLKRLAMQLAKVV